MGDPKERQPIQEGALTIHASGEQYKNKPPPGPLPPMARIERVQTPVYIGKDNRPMRTTWQLTATVNTLEELDALVERVRSELRAAEIKPTDIGEIKIVHREKQLLRPSGRGE